MASIYEDWKAGATRAPTIDEPGRYPVVMLGVREQTSRSGQPFVSFEYETSDGLRFGHAAFRNPDYPSYFHASLWAWATSVYRGLGRDIVGEEKAQAEQAATTWGGPPKGVVWSQPKIVEARDNHTRDVVGAWRASVVKRLVEGGEWEGAECVLIVRQGKASKAGKVYLEREFA